MLDDGKFLVLPGPAVAWNTLDRLGRTTKPRGQCDEEATGPEITSRMLSSKLHPRVISGIKRLYWFIYLVIEPPFHVLSNTARSAKTLRRRICQVRIAVVDGPKQA